MSDINNTQDFSQSVMIALLPTTSDWCRIDLPHMTLVYAGQIPDLAPGAHNELAKVALNLAMACHKLRIVVMGKDVFGQGPEMVEALKLRADPELIAMRNIVESWNASQYTEFSPHATIGPIGSGPDVIPDYLIFDRIAVAWGKDVLQFNLLE